MVAPSTLVGAAGGVAAQAVPINIKAARDNRRMQFPFVKMSPESTRSDCAVSLETANLSSLALMKIIVICVAASALLASAVAGAAEPAAAPVGPPVPSTYLARSRRHAFPPTPRP